MQFTDAALLLLFPSYWALRSLIGSRGCSLDVISISLYIFWSISTCLSKLQTPVWIGVVASAFAVLFWQIYAGVLSYGLRDFEKGNKHSVGEDVQVREPLTRPYVIPCRTTHSRIFPKKHQFAYSYLHVAVPLNLKSSTESLQSQHAETNVLQIRGLPLSVRAADYLERGDGHLGLVGKLQAYLQSQGEDPATYTSAWLFTAPRFLGYSFNPVSFWYLYKGSHLSAMILEVNNTFDERRLYFMKDAGTSNGSTGARFSNSWPKDFHVSPFNSRKGSYSLVAKNPLSKAGLTIDNTITLNSSKNHPKIVARLCSTGAAIEIAKMSFASKVHFIASWWWVGLVTYPRIVKEAGRLFFKRRLRVWYRPEVLPTSIGRNENEQERIIESSFRRFLKFSIENSRTHSALTYIASGSNCVRKETFASKKPDIGMSETPNLILQILSPAFYAQFAVSASPADLIVSSPAQPPLTQTMYASDPSAVGELVEATLDSRPALPASNFAWKLLRMLRGSSNSTPHPLDEFVRSQAPAELATAYRSAVAMLLVGKWLTLGSPELLDAAIGLMRIVLGLLCSRIVMAGVLEPEFIVWEPVTVTALLHVWLVAEEVMSKSGGPILDGAW